MALIPFILTEAPVMNVRIISRISIIAFSLLVASQALIAQKRSRVFTGVVGESLVVRMVLDDEPLMEGGRQNGTRYTGTYSHANTPSPVPIAGTYKWLDGKENIFPRVILREQTGSEMAGTFSGQINGQGYYIGLWTSADETETLPFTLRAGDSSGNSMAEEEHKRFMAFIADFQAALKGGNKNKLADMTIFPLPGSGYLVGKMLRGITRDEFMKHYGKIFDAPARKALLQMKTSNVVPRIKEEKLSDDGPVPIGTVVYEVFATYGKDGGGPSVSFGFANVNGEFKLVFLQYFG